ncbi:hypothetical protein [Pseudomonas aeruginosa]|uniref:hypothetical protein n=1 Tax=Pseudomonas aeruginosa TaxID=287 RepID=UPI0015967D64|nr:hypothetical protein [Pseudomonas aeruginosa]
MTEEEHDAKLAAEAQALREEVARSEQHRNDQADLIVSLRTEVAALRMARDDLKLERDLARQNFCDEQAANYQLQAHLKACLGELSELRARVVVPDGYALVPIEPTVAMRMPWKTMRGHSWYSKYKAMLEAAPRLNGKTVSEGLLRRVTADPDYEEVFTLDRGEALTELLDLLNQDKENGNG